MGSRPDQADIATLTPEREVAAFLESSFRDSAGNLAKATAFLPASTRAEARLAFLACRALDAFEDLPPTAAESRFLLEQCTAYLCGRVAVPPRLPAIAATRRSDRVEALIASRLDVLRMQLEALPGRRRGRVQSLISAVAAAMIELAGARRSRYPAAAARYGERVLGSIARYALDLLGAAAQGPCDHGILGRAAQAANDLRDWREDPGASDPACGSPALSLLLELLESASGVTGALGSLRFPLVSRGRAAVAYLVATTARSCCTVLGVPVSRRLAAPRSTAFRVMLSPAAYRRFLIDLEHQVVSCALAAPLDARTPRCAAAPLLAIAGRRQADFETRLAMSHPAPQAAIALSRAVGLSRLAIRLRAALPTAPLDGSSDVSVAGAAVMLSDYLLSIAVAAVAPLGSTVLREFSDFLSSECEASAGSSLHADSRGELAALLSRIALRARGIVGSAAAAEEHRSRLRAQQLHRLDRRQHAAATA